MNAQLMAYSIQRMAELINFIHVAKGTPDAEPTKEDVDAIADAVHEKFVTIKVTGHSHETDDKTLMYDGGSILDQIVKEETERRLQ